MLLPLQKAWLWRCAGSRILSPLTSQCSAAYLLFCYLVFPLAAPSLSPACPSLGRGCRGLAGRGSRAAVSRVVLGWDSPGGAGAGAGASFLPSRPGEARGAGMSWLHTLLLALWSGGWLLSGCEQQCRLSMASSAGNLAGTVLAAPTGQDGTRMGCSLTSRPAPLSCGAFPFLHPAGSGMSCQLRPSLGTSLTQAGCVGSRHSIRSTLGQGAVVWGCRTLPRPDCALAPPQ